MTRGHLVLEVVDSLRYETPSLVLSVRTLPGLERLDPRGASTDNSMRVSRWATKELRKLLSRIVQIVKCEKLLAFTNTNSNITVPWLQQRGCHRTQNHGPEELKVPGVPAFPTVMNTASNFSRIPG